MRLALLTGDGLEHRYVAGLLAERFPTELAAIITAERMPLPERMRSWRRRYSFSQVRSRLAARAFRKWHALDARREATVSRILFGGHVPPALPRPDLRRVVSGHNRADCVSLLASLAPDVIVVYGTGVIRERVIGVPTRGIVNLHTGLSPWYRGSDTIFWPIHNGEPERIGVTVHLLTAGIDAGGILGTARPPIEPLDDEDSLFAKGVRIGSELLADAVTAIADGTARATPQDLEAGREYRFVDRDMHAEQQVLRLVKEGLLARAAAAPR